MALKDQQEIQDAPGLIPRNNLKAAKDNMPALSPVKLRFVHHATNLFDIPDSYAEKDTSSAYCANLTKA
jgi:hypothetical protein